MYGPAFLDRVKTAVDKSVGSPSAPKKGELVAKPLMQALIEQTGSQTKAQEVMNNTIIPYLNGIGPGVGGHVRKKSLGSVDIAALRIVSLSDRTAVQRNEETKFLNFLESKGDMPPILDYQYRIKERVMSRVSTPFNVDSSLPGIVQSPYNQRYNTLTAIGDTLKVSFMASSIAEQQSDVNVLEEQIDDEIVAIRRGFNNILLSNTELVSEAVGNVPQMGGFITRSTLNSQNAGGSNLTNTLLQTAVNNIGNVLGWGHQFMCWCTPGQLPVVRDIMINRYPGENSAAFFQTMRSQLNQQLVNYMVETQVAYISYPGGVMPVIYDSQMPADTAIVFAADYPRLARFKMDGQVGPFVLARPEQTLYEVVCVFDFCTLDDPLTVSRSPITGLAS